MVFHESGQKFATIKIVCKIRKKYGRPKLSEGGNMRLVDLNNKKSPVDKTLNMAKPG